MSVRVREISFRYESHFVLRNISFDVQSGEFASLVGPNGSGKSTLLKILTRLLTPQKGEIFILNRDIKYFSQKELAKTVGFVPQDNSFVFPFTVLEVVLMGRAPYPKRFGFETKKDIEIAEEAMNLTDIVHLADKPITSLSYGERQRVLIARALAQEPKIILLDEPNAHLDIQHQIEIFSLLKALTKEKNLTVISVSHDLNLVSSYSDRVILLSNGEIFANGKPEDVLTKENLESVFKTDVLVDENPITGLPRITPLPDKIRRVIDKLKIKNGEKL